MSMVMQVKNKNYLMIACFDQEIIQNIDIEPYLNKPLAITKLTNANYSSFGWASSDMIFSNQSVITIDTSLDFKILPEILC